jgi:hypothetical protein
MKVTKVVGWVLLACLIGTSPVNAASFSGDAQRLINEYNESVKHYRGVWKLLKDTPQRKLVADSFNACHLMDRGKSQQEVMAQYVRVNYRDFEEGTQARHYGWLYAAHFTDAAIETLCPEHKDGKSGLAFVN